MTDIFDIQIDIAGKIATDLKAQLTSNEKERIERRPTTEPTAYDYYLKGREYHLGLSIQSNKRAIGLFKKALEIDPNYAPAYAGLSDAYRTNEFYRRDVDACFDSAKTMSEKAIALDPNCFEAYCSLGKILKQQKSIIIKHLK